MTVPGAVALSGWQRKLLFGVVLITCLAYRPSLENAFTGWDDNVYVTDNQKIRELSLRGVADIFSTTFGGMYQPLVLATYALEYAAVGDKPFLYHLDNLLLHAANTLLVFALVFLLSGDYAVSLLTGLLFGIHPLHVESVAWVSERKDVLYGFFFLASLVFYVRHKRTGSWKHYLASVLLFALSMISKPQAVLFFVVLLLLDFGCFHAISRRTLVEKAPFLAISALFVAINAVGMSRFSSMRGDHLVAFIGNFRDAAYGMLWYPWKLLVPGRLSCIYPHPGTVAGLGRALYFFSPFLLALLLALVAYSMKHTRKIVFAGLFVAVNLVIPVYSAPSQNSLVYDRYSYVPSIGVLYLASAGAVWAQRASWRYSRQARVAVPLAIALAIGSFFVQTWKRCGVWKDGATLWSDVVEQYPAIPIAQNNLGVAMVGQGRLAEAVWRFREAIRLDPRHTNAHINLGNVLAQVGRHDEAIFSYAAALRINPRRAEARGNLGNALVALGRIDDAVVQYREVLRTQPRNAQAHCNLAVALARQGRGDEALGHFREALRIEPGNACARGNLERARAVDGGPGGAVGR